MEGTKLKWEKNWELIRSQDIPKEIRMAKYVRDCSMRAYLKHNDPELLAVAKQQQQLIENYGTHK